MLLCVCVCPTSVSTPIRLPFRSFSISLGVPPSLLLPLSLFLPLRFSLHHSPCPSPVLVVACAPRKSARVTLDDKQAERTPCSGSSPSMRAGCCARAWQEAAATCPFTLCAPATPWTGCSAGSVCYHYFSFCIYSSLSAQCSPSRLSVGSRAKPLAAARCPYLAIDETVQTLMALRGH